MNGKQFLAIWIGGCLLYWSGNLVNIFGWWTIISSLLGWIILIVIVPELLNKN